MVKPPATSSGSCHCQKTLGRKVKPENQWIAGWSRPRGGGLRKCSTGKERGHEDQRGRRRGGAAGQAEERTARKTLPPPARPPPPTRGNPPAFPRAGLSGARKPAVSRSPRPAARATPRRRGIRTRRAARRGDRVPTRGRASRRSAGNAPSARGAAARRGTSSGRRTAGNPSRAARRTTASRPQRVPGPEQWRGQQCAQKEGAREVEGDFEEVRHGVLQMGQDARKREAQPGGPVYAALYAQRARLARNHRGRRETRGARDQVRREMESCNPSSRATPAGPTIKVTSRPWRTWTRCAT